MAVALEKSPEPVVATTAASSKNIEAGVEAALIQALALDAAEDAAEPSLEAATAEPTEGSLTVNLAEAAPVVPESQPETTLADPEPRKLYVTGTRVNVRDGPSTQYRVVGTVSYGDPVELVTFEGQSWARIRFGDGEKTGFMSRRFLADELAGG